MKILTHHLNPAKHPIDREQSFMAFCQKHEVVFHSENCFSVKDISGKYLTAFRDESIKFHSDTCNSWEKFYVLDDEIESLIDFSIKKLSCDYRLFLHNNKIHVLIDEKVITPSFIPPAKLTIGEWFVEYKTLTDKNRLQTAKPLIYFCIYGKDEYYECFYLSVKSLIEKGHYTGDILIKADNIEKARDFCNQFDNHFIFSEINTDIGIFNRYWLHEECLKNYSSIIYFDSDILTIKNISDVLKHLQKDDLTSYMDADPEWARKYFYDDATYNAHKWYGMQYINKEFVKKTDEFYIFNSGLFAINNLEKVKPIMDKIVQYRFIEDSHGDQPFFNIALYNSGIGVSTLNELGNLAFSRSSYQSFKNLDKALIHFNSGVGNVSKLSLMQETWNYISNKKS